MNFVAELFNCNEDLFYAIYDYLRFEKPEKWNFIKSLDDFSFVDISEMKDLATNTCNWLETLVSNIYGYVEDPYSKNTLYYMTLAYMNSHNEYWGTPTYSQRNKQEREEVSMKAIEWLRSNIDKIK